MTRDSRKRRPAKNAAPEVMATTTTSILKSTDQDDHGAIIAADAANGLWRFLWEQAVTTEAAAGHEVSADTVQVKYGLPDIGNGTGGVFMGLHRRGVIRRVGYRPSSRSSRAGGVIAVWAAVKEAA